MANLSVLHPVRTLDNQLLVPAETDISEETLSDIIHSVQKPSYPSNYLLSHKSVKQDLKDFLGFSPYDFIFSDKEQLAELIGFMETAKLSLPVLESLDYFKRHDPYTYRHSIIVFALTTLLAKDLMTDFSKVTQEAEAGPVHDIGKICVPLEIIKKSKPLTLEERKLLEHHAAAGYILLSYYLQDSKNLIARIARDHHERRDGSGYPRGFKIDDLLVEIVAVSDIYDALISVRPYRPVSYDNRTALEEITGMAEKKIIGWEVVKLLTSHNRKDKPYYREITISKEKRGTPPPGNVYGVIAEKD